MSIIEFIIQYIGKNINKIIDFVENHRSVALIKLGLFIFISYIVLNEFYLKSRYLEEAKRNNIITKRIGNIVEACGNYSFVSWLTVGDTKLDIKEKEIEFNNVIGCLKSGDDKHCPVSVKISNSAYLNSHQLGYDDYVRMKNDALYPDGMVVSCKISNRIVSCPDYTPNILQKLINLTNFELSDISFTLVRDYKKDLIWIFTLAFTTNSNPTCTLQTGNSLLENLSRTAKENL